MLSLYKKYWRTAFDIALIALTVWLIMYVFSFLYRIATPVFLSFLIFPCIEPLARRLHRLGLRKSIAAGISTLVFILVILGSLVGIGYIFARQITQLQESLPVYQNILKENVASLTAELQSRVEAFHPDLAARLNEAVEYVTGLFSRLAADFLNWLVGFLASFSSFVVNFLIAIVLAYFLSVEIDTWKTFAAERTPKTLRLALAFLRENVFRGIVTYLKAQAKLISLTFAIIFLALLLLGVPNAFAIALLAAFFDVLPLLGVSTLFIPWIAYLFITGDTELGLWLTGLLVVVTGARQVLEPRITGQTIGVSAFTMLSFMIVSLSLFGVMGLILAPILMILLKSLYDQGYLHKWIRLPQDEFVVSPLKPSGNAGGGDASAKAAAPGANGTGRGNG